MADYPDRDMHVEKEGSSSFLETCACTVDPRERHFVRKLDRYQLEDRHLRLLEEVHSLKKLSNDQEDKIKRLATKLRRYGANPRTCIATIDFTDDHDKIVLLEAENSKLRDQVTLLRNQLLNHKIFGRSPSRARRLLHGSSSGPTTCRSESSRLKAPSCQCNNARPGNDDNDVQNCSLKIQEMEAEKKEMLSRITELEVELSSYTSGNRREKVAENVEYIRVWRQMKRQNEMLVAAQSANEILNKQIYELKNLLEESTKNNDETNAELEVERNQVAHLDESISRVNDSQTDLKEKDQRIVDLTCELKIIQNHNQELLELSSLFSQTEQENSVLKRKIHEQQAEYQNIKDVINTKETNMLALQAANDQLLEKLHGLQKHIDGVTIQLKGQNENFKIDKSNDLPSTEEKSAPKEELLKENTNDTDDGNEEISLHEKGIQTNNTLQVISETTQTEKPLDSAKIKNNAPVEKCDKSKSKIQLPPNGSSLSREEMLKLLEQVQISSPMESQNATRLRHREVSIPIGIPRQVTNLESLLFGD